MRPFFGANQYSNAAAVLMLTAFSTTVLTGLGMRKLWETVRLRIQNLAFWASQRLLFDPTKFASLFLLHRESLVLLRY